MNPRRWLRQDDEQFSDAEKRMLTRLAKEPIPLADFNGFELRTARRLVRRCVAIFETPDGKDYDVIRLLDGDQAVALRSERQAESRAILESIDGSPRRTFPSDGDTNCPSCGARMSAWALLDHRCSYR